jgi:hypothetical protein
MQLNGEDVKFYVLFAYTTDDSEKIVGMVGGRTAMEAFEFMRVEYQKQMKLEKNVHINVRKLYESDSLLDAETFHSRFMQQAAVTKEASNG